MASSDYSSVPSAEQTVSPARTFSEEEVSSLKYCAVCREPEAKKCGRCKLAAYCSIVCQETDWPLHKLLCSASAHIPERPSKSHKLGIMLPELGEPRWEWIENDSNAISVEESTRLFKIQSADLPFDQPIMTCTIINTNQYRGFLDVPEAVCMDLLDRSVGRPRNRCVSIMTGGKPHEWHGPIFLMRHRGGEQDDYPYEEDESNQLWSEDILDTNLADFRLVADYFLWNNNMNGAGFLGPLWPAGGNTVKGVIVHCKGAITDDNQPGTSNETSTGVSEYSPIAVPKDHPIFKAADAKLSTPSIPALLGLPVLTRKLNTTGLSTESLNNPGISSIHINTTETPSLVWGAVPSYWNMDVGNVLVVHKDKKDITVDQVRLLLRYAQLVHSAVEDFGGRNGNWMSGKRRWSKARIRNVLLKKGTFDAFCADSLGSAMESLSLDEEGGEGQEEDSDGIRDEKE